MHSIFVLLIALRCISVASTDQCYACDNTDNSACGDPFNATSMGDGDKNDLPPGGACVKTKLETKGGVQISRHSTLDTTDCLGGKNGCSKDFAGGQTTTVCCCTGNLCNGVLTLRQQPLTIIFVTIAMFIYRHF